MGHYSNICLNSPIMISFVVASRFMVQYNFVVVGTFYHPSFRTQHGYDHMPCSDFGRFADLRQERKPAALLVAAHPGILLA